MIYSYSILLVIHKNFNDTKLMICLISPLYKYYTSSRKIKIKNRKIITELSYLYIKYSFSKFKIICHIKENMLLSYIYTRKYFFNILIDILKISEFNLLNPFSFFE